MELTQEEKEMLAGFIGTNWQAFTTFAEEFMSDRAMHVLAEKLELQTTI